MTLTVTILYGGASKTDKKVTDLEKVTNRKNLNILNNKSPTYLNPSTVSYSAIDITLPDPSSYMDYTWKVHDDPCGSYPFPIILEITLPIHDNNKLPAGKQIWSTGNNLKPCAIEDWFKAQIAQF